MILNKSDYFAQTTYHFHFHSIPPASWRLVHLSIWYHYNIYHCKLLGDLYSFSCRGRQLFDLPVAQSYDPMDKWLLKKNSIPAFFEWYLHPDLHQSILLFVQIKLDRCASGHTTDDVTKCLCRFYYHSCFLYFLWDLFYEQMEKSHHWNWRCQERSNQIWTAGIKKSSWSTLSI